jgi:hypothetical protein
MIVGLILFGVLSFVYAYYWYKKLNRLSQFIEPLAVRYGEPDTSGNKHYTNCKSHQWVMKNIVYGNYLQQSEGFRNFMMNRTVTGTLLLGIFLGLIPVIIVYILFQSFNMIGTSLILLILSVFIIRGPGQLEVSHRLLRWQSEQEQDAFKIGDLAYARVSQKAIKDWMRNLVIVGVISFIAAPWGEQIPVGFAYLLTLFIGFFYSNLFQPLAMVSMPLAVMVFFLIGPLIFAIVLFVARSMRSKIVKEEGMIL